MNQLKAHQPDLVILDLMMPEMDGFEVCDQIRQLSDVPIIILTVLEQEHNAAQSLECGANEYITKPFKSKTLMVQVQALLG